MRSGTLVVLVSMAGACATAPLPPETKSVNLTCEYPVIAAAAETKEVQTKGGIEITVAARRVECVPHTERQTAPRAPNQSEQLEDALRGIVTPRTETTTTPVLKPEPERVTFIISINNQLSRVFRGRGAVVQFALEGSAWAGQEADYAPFTNLMILPRGHAQIEVLGPPVQALKGSTGIMGISLFDVVTGMDGAGNVTEKQNFDWLYQYRIKAVDQAATATIERQ